MVDCGVTENTSSDRVELGLGMTDVELIYTLPFLFAHICTCPRTKRVLNNKF